ncbi:MAG: peptide ABC transporter substrate-binding protein [Lysobacteraceae bacterium]|nr:MAG: peptide ABC transporter substrate-binding protein [Xanthomonadaceae bacterium]
MPRAFIACFLAVCAHMTRAPSTGALFALLLCCCAVQAHAQSSVAVRLERGNGPEPATLDAHKCQEVACSNVLRDLYEGLVSEDAAGRLIPGMAESWTVSADGRRWTFRLRSDLRWSNGEPLTAQAVLASFRRAFAPETAAPFAEQFDAIEHVAAVRSGALPPERLGIDAPDARTVRIRTTRQIALPALLTLPIAFPVYLPAVARHGHQHTRPGRLVGNGAYRLRAWTPQANLEVERNPYFHAATAVMIERVRFHVTEDAAAELQRFAAGDLHLTETVPPQPLPALRRRFGSRLRISPYLGAFWLGLNLSQPPLREDQRLREALSLAVDRGKLTRYVTGFGETPAYGIVPPGIPGYTPAALHWADWEQSRREAHARALYRAAGYGPERPLVIELRYNTSIPHRRMALAVAAMWRQTLGVRVRLRNEEWKVFVQNRKQRTITQVFRGGWIGDVADARNFLVAFSDDGALNWPGYADARYRELFAKAEAARDETARNAWLHAAETRLLHAHAMIPLYFYTSKHLVSDRIEGFAANPMDRHPSRWLRLRP